MESFKSWGNKISFNSKDATLVVLFCGVSDAIHLEQHHSIRKVGTKVWEFLIFRWIRYSVLDQCSLLSMQDELTMSGIIKKLAGLFAIQVIEILFNKIIIFNICSHGMFLEWWKNKKSLHHLRIENFFMYFSYKLQILKLKVCRPKYALYVLLYRNSLAQDL